MAGEYNVADLVAEFLVACKVPTAFGVASVHNLPLLDAIGRRNAIRFIMARGEMGAAHMADGFARASGGSRRCHQQHRTGRGQCGRRTGRSADRRNARPPHR